jgi:hypothetical protein
VVMYTTLAVVTSFLGCSAVRLAWTAHRRTRARSGTRAAIPLLPMTHGPNTREYYDITEAVAPSTQPQQVYAFPEMGDRQRPSGSGGAAYSRSSPSTAAPTQERPRQQAVHNEGHSSRSGNRWQAIFSGSAHTSAATVPARTSPTTVPVPPLETMPTRVAMPRPIAAAAPPVSYLHQQRYLDMRFRYVTGNPDTATPTPPNGPAKPGSCLHTFERR